MSLHVPLVCLLFVVLVRPGAAQPNEDSAARQLDVRFAVVEREAARLRQAGARAEAEELTRRLRYFRDRLDGKATPADVGSELHVVGLYEGTYPEGARPRNSNVPGSAAVRVAGVDRPVVLVLCAYSAIKWDLQIDKNVRLEKVLLGGYHEQEVTNVPPGVKVEKATHDGRSRDHFFAHARSHSEEYANTARLLRKKTGLEIATFQGGYAYKGQPIVVGTENEEWRAQRVLTELRSVYEEAAAFERAKQREAVAAMRFHALHIVRTGRHGHEVARSFGPFTPAGPILSSLRPVADEQGLSATDPEGPVRYGIARNSLYRLDPKTGEKTEVKGPAKFPRLSQPCGLAFDTKRRRLLVAIRDDGGHLLAYSPKDGAWSVLRELHDVRGYSLSYMPEEDSFYALNHPYGSLGAVCLNAEGAVLRYLPLEVPVPTSGGSPRHDNFQLAVAGRHLAVLSPPLPDLNDPDLTDRVFCTLVDPRNGKTVYSGTCEPHTGDDAAPKPEEYAVLWDALKQPDDLDADRTQWRLAAGGDKVVAFLRPRFQEVKAPDPTQIRDLIDQLESDDFTKREAATTALGRFGGAAEVDLRRALAATPTLERKRRLEALVRDIEDGPTRDPELRREKRTILTLMRIGSPAAVEALRGLAAGKDETLRARQARAALQHLGRR